jgi:hypothetical protein
MWFVLSIVLAFRQCMRQSKGCSLLPSPEGARVVGPCSAGTCTRGSSLCCSSWPWHGLAYFVQPGWNSIHRRMSSGPLYVSWCAPQLRTGEQAGPLLYRKRCHGDPGGGGGRGVVRGGCFACRECHPGIKQDLKMSGVHLNAIEGGFRLVTVNFPSPAVV